MTVRRALVQAGAEVYAEEPETEAGVRTVTLPAMALEALRAQHRLQKTDKQATIAAGEPYGREGWVVRHGRHPVVARFHWWASRDSNPGLAD